ncbi:MAG: hypothetical protein WC217_00660 [Candidatus Paceibacterota bacterium]|jgi:hypothetical protein
MKPDTNTILLILATLVVAAGAYWYFFTGTGNEPPLTTVVTQNEAQSHFKVLVSELTPITFDTAIFSEPSFMALTDLATPVTSETSGRLDPFAAIAGVSAK